MGGGMFLRGCLLSALLLLACESQVLAEGFRCPKTDRLVEVGYTMKDVVARCGPPLSREDLFETDCTQGGNCYLVRTGEIWTYDFGPSYLTRILYFRGVSLFKVEEGMYGR
jgi:Protein of unknown function (DUF2845)